MYNRLFCCNHTCYCVGIVTVTIASRSVTSASRCESRFSMCIRGLIPWNSTELAEAVPIGRNICADSPRPSLLDNARSTYRPCANSSIHVHLQKDGHIDRRTVVRRDRLYYMRFFFQNAPIYQKEENLLLTCTCGSH